MEKQSQIMGKALKSAFPYTVPIFAGFLFLGMTYGIYMNVSGFSFWYPMFMSLTIFAGSAEFVAVNLLLGPFRPFQALAMTLMLNARHLFYGISMLDKYRGTGLKKIYLIFGMCDESFSINCTAEIPEDVDRGCNRDCPRLWAGGSCRAVRRTRRNRCRMPGNFERGNGWVYI